MLCKVDNIVNECYLNTAGLVLLVVFCHLKLPQQQSTSTASLFCLLVTKISFRLAQTLGGRFCPVQENCGALYRVAQKNVPKFA